MRSRKMKISRWFGISLLFLLLIPTTVFAEEQAESALFSGTYFPTITVKDQSQQLELPLKVTITSADGRVDRKMQVGIDGRNFEYDKKINLKGLDKQKLAEMAEIHFWSSENGETLAVDEVKVDTLDAVESKIVFYNFAKNVQKTVHAYKSGDEIHGNKKYSQVQLQKYNNIKGDGQERPWRIEHRTMLTYIIFIMTVCPVILVIALIIFVYLQTEQLDKIVRKKKHKKRVMWLLLPALLGFGMESSAADIKLNEVYLTQEKASELAEKNQLASYLIDESGIRNQITLTNDTEVKVDTDQLAKRLKQPRKQTVRFYQSKSLKVGDYENYIVITIAIYAALIALPLFYFLNRRFADRQKG